MSQNTSIFQGYELQEFLRNSVKRAIVSRQVEASEMSEFYIVNLLSDFKDSDRFFVREGDHYEEEALAILLAKAMSSDLPNKIKLLKRMGDHALYTAGFFADHIERRMVDLDYYSAMGGGAYLSLSAILSNNKTFSNLYGELANKFKDFVDVLTEVSLLQKNHSNVDILRLYERWLKTGDDRIRQVLEDEGIQPDIGKPLRLL